MINKLIFIILFFPALVLAETQDSNLVSILNSIHTMQADFVQIVANDSSNIQQSSGVIALQRPGKFRWEVLNPTKQLIIINNIDIIIYDYDLNQISKRKISYKQVSNPALLLSSSVQKLQHDFNIKKLMKNGNGLWFELKPKANDSLFQKVQLQFIDGELRTMVIIDNLEQKSTINFFNEKINSPLDSKTFTLVAPKEVDVI